MLPSRTKIVCTVGPACEDPAVLRGLIEAGADVFRINGSHVPVDQIAPWIRRIRRAGREMGQTVGTMIDLPGTKVRLGRFAVGDRVELIPGEEVRLFAGTKGGSATRLPIHPMRMLHQVPAGNAILLADGQIQLEAIGHDGKDLRAEVIHGGTLLSGKGVDFPGARLPTKVPTVRDRRIANEALANGIDLLALSFVRDVSDVIRGKRLVAAAGREHVPIIAKIEREDAVEDLDAILSRANVALIARGDLGVDVGPERVPSIQRRIIEACRRHGRPAIVATEMLESMIERVRPTRAEASDVAGAVFEGADAVMLSAESAIGRHPITAVATMSRILSVAEADPVAPYAGGAGVPAPLSNPARPDQQVVHAAVMLAEQTQAHAIVVFTREGASAVRLSKERPRAPIHAFAPDDKVCRRLSLAWGTHARRLPAGRNTDMLVKRVAARLCKEEGFPEGTRVVLVMGGALDPAGATTLIKVVTL